MLDVYCIVVKPRKIEDACKKFKLNAFKHAFPILRDNNLTITILAIQNFLI